MVLPDSDCESNTSVVFEIPGPWEFERVHVAPLKACAPSAPPYEEELYIRPDYGVNNVILGGKWNIYPSLSILREESCSISTIASEEQTQVIIEDNSIIQEGRLKSESDPLITTVTLCQSCKKRYTTKKKHNYVVILLLVFIAFLSIFYLFPWGLGGIAALCVIPKFLNVPTCKKCRRRWC